MAQPLSGLPGWWHIALDETRSTNAECIARANKGDVGKLWITATTQTAGKGRRGNVWQSPPGNLFASVLLIANRWESNVATLSFVAANALFDAIQKIPGTASTKLQLKWPNDLLLDGAKIAGILLERTSLADGRDAVVIGWGVNCKEAPENTPYPASSLAAHQIDVTPERLFEALAQSMADALEQWDEGRGFARTRDQWLMHAKGLGEDIVVRLPGRNITGRFVSIDADGRLELKKTDGSIEKISSGDVFFTPEIMGSDPNN